MRPTIRVLLSLLLAIPAAAQPEVMGWGNLTGIRVDGHLLEFGTALCVAQPDGAGITPTGKERQTSNYTREGRIEKELRVWVTDAGRGMKEGARIPVEGGKAEFTLEATSFTTLMSAQAGMP